MSPSKDRMSKARARRRQSHLLRLMAQHDGRLRAQAVDRQRGAQAHRPITDDRHACACLDVRADRRVMACRHDISQGQKSLEQGLISLHFWRHNDQGGISKACPNRLGGLLAFMPKALDTTLQARAVALSLSGQTDEIGSSLDISSCVSCTGSAKHECHHVVTDRRRSRRHTWLHPPGRSRQGTVLHLL